MQLTDAIGMIGSLSNERMARQSLACRKRGFPASSRMQQKWLDLALAARTYKRGHAHTGIQIEIGGQSTHG
jgi:hypothetical protein